MPDKKTSSAIQIIEEFESQLSEAHAQFVQKLENIKKQALQKAESSEEKKEEESLHQLELELKDA
ncbi:hypothetical protein K9M59_01195 [Candidatus Gracilibacteria bacterium]|nr:hypothetical protein [Candidatus Gracilibacteria bacterium]MCF7819183.1 hypothetical protein [Candidatus Gracilibacteria bacterium]